MTTDLTQKTKIQFPVIMAPMFLVSNETMVKAAMEEGIMGTFPTLNYRNEGELETILDNLNSHRSTNNLPGNYGVNLIVQKTNPLFEKHLKICVEKKVPFYITSLGSPKEVIAEAHKYGAVVFCDVTNIDHARKCAELGADGFIAVGQGAGGHAGPFPLQMLVPSLKNEFPNMPVVSAGGVSSGAGILSMLALGASGVSVGTHFIATVEAGVNDAYKNAIVNAKMGDIVMTTKISGTPCTIINTDYAKKIGYEQNWLEKLLSRNKRTKKYFKMLVQLRGMNKLQDSVQPASYKTLWCAGQSVELINKVETVKEILDRYKLELKEANRLLNQKMA
jgi:nitronate monooxygenase